MPKELHRIEISESDGEIATYLDATRASAFVAGAQMGTIEYHIWGARSDRLDRPDRLVFDLDPDEELDFADVKQAARDIRARLSDIGLVSFAMLSGGKGVHVVVPLKTGHSWDEHKDFARRFAMALAQADPDRFTAALAKARRTGRIFIDYLRNQRGATAVMPYSARSRPLAPIAVPLSWEELRDLDSPACWHIGDAAEMVKRAGSKALAQWGRADQVLPDL